MRKIVLYLILAAAASAVSTCSDNSSNPGERRVSANLRQISGCVSTVLSTRTVADSSFEYLFGDTLFFSFLLSGNCCPDSNRFALSYELNSDTLHVAAMDTAAHLCRCICNYVVRAEFANLPLDHYTLICTRSDDSGKVYYSETVIRGSAGR